jgi:hypothetical protein
VAVGEDEFVELDESGAPRKKAQRAGRRPAPAVRRKAPARRRPSVAPPPVAAGPEPAAEEVDVDADDGADATEVDATAATAARRSPPAAGRRKGRGDAAE